MHIDVILALTFIHACRVLCPEGNGCMKETTHPGYAEAATRGAS